MSMHFGISPLFDVRSNICIISVKPASLIASTVVVRGRFAVYRIDTVKTFVWYTFCELFIHFPCTNSLFWPYVPMSFEQCNIVYLDSAGVYKRGHFLRPNVLFRSTTYFTFILLNKTPLRVCNKDMLQQKCRLNTIPIDMHHSMGVHAMMGDNQCKFT